MLIPIFVVRDVPEAIAFYAEVLDFELVLTLPSNVPNYAIMKRGQDQLHLNLTPGQGRFGHCAAVVPCENVDGLFAFFRRRGLDTSARPDSPVHSAPVTQSWGTREVYVDDPSGNTLIFQQRLPVPSIA